MIKTHDGSGGQRRYRTVIYSFRRPVVLVAFVILIVCAFFLAQQIIRRAEGAEPAQPATAKAAPPQAKPQKPAADRFAWRSLFDGKSLGQWKSIQFGGEGEVRVEDGAIVMDTGNSMTGVAYSGKLPKMNYELALEGKRVSGNDFFCTTTFPIGEAHCSLVVGGWAGTVVGISCVDFYDASDNATTKFMDFKNNQWYKIRIRVTKDKLEAWIDDEQVVDFETDKHRFSVRDECDLCKPLGVATWTTAGAIRNMRVRELRADEINE